VIVLTVDAAAQANPSEVRGLEESDEEGDEKDNIEAGKAEALDRKQSHPDVETVRLKTTLPPESCDTSAITTEFFTIVVVWTTPFKPDAKH
jgi:hypothetical protein